MKEKGERLEELEIQLQKLERDNESLQKKVASLEITCEKVRYRLDFHLLCILRCQHVSIKFPLMVNFISLFHAIR